MFTDALIDERIKGFEYARESERVTVIDEQQIWFNGRHAIHMLVQIDSEWTCDCAKFALMARPGLVPFCAHIIAVERVLAAEKATSA